MSPASAQILENLARVRERIELAAARAGRRGDEITLVAVSKTHSAERILEMYEAGVRHFGENRVQERESKEAALAGLTIAWHMIGHVQSNKAARAVQLFDTIDTVDSLALAERFDRLISEIDAQSGSNRANPGTAADSSGAVSPPRLRLLIEVKLDPTPAKSGVDGDVAVRLAEEISRLPHLDLQGFMGVPPYFDDPEPARPYFRHLRELRDAARGRLGPETLPVLSMGMSHDLEVAIEEGATEVRVGTALFGERIKI